MPDLDVLRRLGDELVPPPLDLLRAHARRRQRRARSLAAAAVAAAAVVGVIGARLHPDPGPTPAVPVDDVRPLSFADGSVVHVGSRAISVPGVVVELDTTDAGVVVRTQDGRVWATDGKVLAQVGDLGDPGKAFREAQPSAGGWVVSEARGPLTAWFEFPRPDRPVLVVYDTTRNRVVVDRTPVTVGGPGSRPVAVDDQAVFWLTSGASGRVRGRLDLATSAQEAVPAAAQSTSLMAAGPARTVLEGARASDGVGGRLGLVGSRLEPAATDAQVWNGRSFEVWGYAAPAGSTPQQTWLLAQWVDDDTVVLQRPGQGRIDLFRCTTSRGSCALTRTVPAYVVLPGG